MLFWNQKWNFSPPETVAQIICLTLLILSLLILGIASYRLILYRNILKIVCEALTEAEKISRNNLQNRFQRLGEIIKKNPNQTSKQNLRIWEIEYKLLIERKFCEEIKTIQNFFVDSKASKPSWTNFQKAQKCFASLQMISQQLYFLWQEVEKVFAWEILERNLRIKTRALFNELIIDSPQILKETNFNYDETNWKMILEQTNKALNLIDQKICEGNYAVAETYQTKTNQQLHKLILLLDLFPTTLKMLSDYLPSKLANIKTQIQNLSHFDLEKENQMQKYQILENQFESSKNQIFKVLGSFNYEQTTQKLFLLTKSLENFEQNLTVEKGLKIFLNTNLYALNSLIQNLEKENDQLNENVQKLQNFKQKQNIFALGKKIKSYLQRWEPFSETLSLALNAHHFEIAPLQPQLIDLLKELIFLYNELIGMSKNLKTSLGFETAIENRLFTLDAILSGIQVLMIKYSHIKNHQHYQQVWKTLIQQWKQLEKHHFAQEKTDLQKNLKNQIIQDLDKQILEALSLKNNLKNKIMLQTLTESSIIYLERFANQPQFEETMISIWKHYEAQDFVETLNLTLAQLQKYNLKKGEIWSIS